MGKHLIFLILFACLGSWAQTGWTLEILSLSPATGVPGTRVTINGGPFADDASVVLGGQAITPDSRSANRLMFSVPELPEGDYLLFVRDATGSSPRSFLFKLETPTPWIASVNPANIDECSTASERQIVISGRDFQKGAQVLVNQAAVTVEEVSATAISFTLPALKGGRQMIEVVNPGGKSSITHSVFVNSIPEILAVTPGEDNVNSYQLEVAGKNFQYGSRLLINGQPVGDASIQRPSADTARTIDCRTMIYTRYPMSRELRRVSLQVVNPGGEQSPLFHVTIP